MIRGLIAGIILLIPMGVVYGHAYEGGYPPTLRGGNSGFSSNVLGVKPSVKQTHKHTNSHLRKRLPTRHTTVPVLAKESGDLATVPTAAGISITVDKKLVPQFQGFIDDLVKLGYTPKHIGCWAPVGTHVANSNHYHGGACDFDQTGWGRTASPMYHVGNLAAKWGLRDGCTFRQADCGHIDDGTNIGWKHPNSLIARYIDFQTRPVARGPEVGVKVIDNFEGGLP